MDGERSVNWLKSVETDRWVEAAAVQNFLWTMECAYWEDVDFNAGKGAAEFYCENAIFDVGFARRSIRRQSGDREVLCWPSGARTTHHSAYRQQLHSHRLECRLRTPARTRSCRSSRLTASHPNGLILRNFGRPRSGVRQH